MNDAADPVEAFRTLWKNGPPDVAAFVAATPLAPDDLTDLLRFDQQERWRAGAFPPVEWYLEQFPQLAADPDGVQVLITGEVIARTERGERPALADFLLRFPGHADFLEPLWEVHFALEDTADTETTGFSSEFAPHGPAAPLLSVPGYEVEAEIGRGAVGVVYRARQAPLNRPVALKVIPEGELGRTDLLRRFMEEGRVIARLKHPNIVGIYDLGTHANGPFMALEWVGGGTLAEKMKGRSFEPTEAARLVATLARAVGHAHENGVVHRDLKPANVLLTEAGEPKVADFGLAKLLQPGLTGGSVSGVPIGTPMYMAPEQTRGGKVTPAADVYGLGAILYELLTGRVPLSGASIADTLRLVAEQPPEPVRKLNARVPRDLEVICLKCLEKDPVRRYQSGNELADDLGRHLAGEPVAARPEGTGGKAGRWLTRHPRWAAAVVLGVAAVFALAGVAAGLAVKLAEARRQGDAAVREVEWRRLLAAAAALARGGRPDEAKAKAAEARSLAADDPGFRECVRAMGLDGLVSCPP